MRIARLAWTGLKSTDRDLALGPLTLLVGAVGSGKSSALEALRFVALGHVPALGKSEVATARLMRDREISVEATLEDGRMFSRSLWRRGGKLQSEAFASWLPPKSGLTETGEAIRALFGASDIEAAEALDLRELLSCSAAERSKRIERLLDASGLSPAVLAARGWSLTWLRLAGVPSERIPAGTEAEATAASCQTLVPDEVRGAAAGVADALRAILGSGGLAAAQDHARQAKLDAAAQVRANVAARAEIEDRLGGPIETLGNLPAERDAVAATMERARRDLETGAEAAVVRQAAGVVLPGLQERAADTARALEAAMEALPRIEQARAEAAALVDPPEVVAPAAVEPDRQAIAEAEALEHRAREEDDAGAAVPLPLPVSTAAESAAVTIAEREAERAASSPWREVEAVASRIFQLGSMLPEPAHAQHVDCGDRLVALAKEHGGDGLAILDRRATARRALGLAELAAAKREEEILDAMQRRTGHAAAAMRLRAEAADFRYGALERARLANAEARAAYADAAGERARALSLNRTARTRLEAEAAYLETTAREAQTAADRSAADLAETEARLAGIASVAVDVDAAARALESSREVLVILDARIARLRQAEIRRAEMTALLAEIDRATAEQKCWAAAEWACQRLREEDLTARAKGLESRMAKFLAAAGRAEEPFLRAGRGVCEFGLRRAGKEIAVEALSGGEHALFIAAMASAVIALRGPDLRALLVEAAELGAGDAAQAMLRGCAAVADEVQVILATNAEIGAPAGWTVHRMSEERAEVGA